MTVGAQSFHRTMVTIGKAMLWRQALSSKPLQNWSECSVFSQLAAFRNVFKKSLSSISVENVWSEVTVWDMLCS